MSKTAKFLLRAGLAFAFLYAAISGFFQPEAWQGFLPGFIFQFGLAPQLALSIFGILELILAAWLLWGVYLELAGLLAFLILLGIVVFNLPQLIIVFRDLSLAMAALALAWEAYQSRRV